MMKRVLRGRMLPLACVFFLLILPNLFYWGHGDTLYERVWYVIFWILCAVYLIVFASFVLQFWQCWRATRR